MTDVVLLDSGPLGMIAHPRANLEIAEWLRSLLRSGIKVLVPEIADYEVRRELLRARKTKSVRRLDDLKRVIGYLPLTTEAMLQAAQFWARTRNLGRPTARDDALDGDVILAAQAATISVPAARTIIATNNLKHLSQLTRAARWDSISAEH